MARCLARSQTFSQSQTTFRIYKCPQLFLASDSAALLFLQFTHNCLALVLVKSRPAFGAAKVPDTHTAFYTPYGDGAMLRIRHKAVCDDGERNTYP